MHPQLDALRRLGLSATHVVLQPPPPAAAAAAAAAPTPAAASAPTPAPKDGGAWDLAGLREAAGAAGLCVLVLDAPLSDWESGLRAAAHVLQPPAPDPATTAARG